MSLDRYSHRGSNEKNMVYINIKECIYCLTWGFGDNYVRFGCSEIYTAKAPLSTDFTHCNGVIKTGKHAFPI